MDDDAAAAAATAALIAEIKITGVDAPAACPDFSCFPGKIQSLLKSQGFTQPTQIQMASWPTAIAVRKKSAWA